MIKLPVSSTAKISPCRLQTINPVNAVVSSGSRRPTSSVVGVSEGLTVGVFVKVADGVSVGTAVGIFVNVADRISVGNRGADVEDSMGIVGEAGVTSALLSPALFVETIGAGAVSE